MDPAYRGHAEAQARLYFLDLVGLVKDLHTAYQAVVAQFSSLLVEYDAVVPRSQLRLYPRYVPRTHEPRALYWGVLFTLRPSPGRRTSAPRRKATYHLKGTFKPEWVFKIAKRSDLLGRFLDFDRRRLALNAACRVISRAFRGLRKATVEKFRRDSSIRFPSGLGAESEREVPVIPDSMVPHELPPALRVALRSGWVGTYILGCVEESLVELEREVAQNPSVQGLRLELDEYDGASFLRPAIWVHGRTGKRYPKLTHRLMQKLGVKEAVRPVLSIKERKRKQISKLQASVANAFNSVREECSGLQLEVTRLLAEVKVIIIPGSCSPSPRTAV